jgi:CzcA family heavy metal efflux pump
MAMTCARAAGTATAGPEVLGRIIGFSIAHRGMVAAAAALFLLLGLHLAAVAPVDVFPEFAPPEVSIQTEAPGLSAREVEALVTIPIEQAIHGAPGLVTLRSSSAAGIATITCIFSDATDVLHARQTIGERLAVAQRRLPAGVETPGITPTVSASSTLLDVGLTAAPGFDPLELRALADWTLRPRLLAVPGVARVTVFGGGVKQYQVLLSQESLRAFGLSLDEAVAAAGESTALAAAGFVETREQSLPIRAEGRIASLDDLRASLVAFRDGVPVRLDQVAQVREGAEYKVGDATVNGAPGVILEIDKAPRANTLEVTRALEAALREVASSLPPGVTLTPHLFRQATFVERAIGNLRAALAWGAALVSIVLFLFLLDLRVTAISLAAIPLSLLTAVAVLRGMGATLNTMTLGGLAIALGEVVDDAIIDVENILRRLRGRRAGAPRDEVVLAASLEVRGAVVHATVIVALAVSPLFFLTGLQGRLFAPLGAAYVLATLASLLVALTVTPALASFLLTEKSEARRETPLLRALKRGYTALLEPLLARPWPGLAAAGTLVLLAALLLPRLGVDLLPDFQEADVIVHMIAPYGTALERSVAAGQEVERGLRSLRAVRSTALKAGRAELGEDTWGPENGELMLALDPALGRYDAVLETVRRRLEDVPGFVFTVRQFLRERIEEVITGARAPVVLKLSGPDLEVLRSEAERDAAALATVPGASQVQAERQALIPQVDVIFDREAAARHGLTMERLRGLVTITLWGVRAGQVYEGQRVFDLWVRAGDGPPAGADAIGSILLDTPDGGRAPLSTLARVTLASQPAAIDREGGTRQAVITASPRGRDIGGFVEEARRRLASRPLPAGYFRSWGGEYEVERETRRELLWLALAAGACIFLVLLLESGSSRLALVMLANVPMALVGGVGAAWLAGGRLSIGSLVGFITLFGLSMRNSILLVSHFRRLETAEGMAPGRGLVLAGCLDRLAPVLMTALVTGLALLPFVLGATRAGQEIERPMAVVILGGLVSSTVLNLLVLPLLYLKAGSRRTTAGA